MDNNMNNNMNNNMDNNMNTNTPNIVAIIDSSNINNNEYIDDLIDVFYANIFLDSLMINSLNESYIYKNVITSDIKKSLNITQYTSHNENSLNATCPITLIDFKENQDIIKLPCNHCFIPDAILHWLEKEKAECPMCRLKLEHITIKSVNENNNQPNPTTNQTPTPSRSHSPESYLLYIDINNIFI